MTHRERRRSL